MRLQPASLLDESHEGSDTRPWANHDNWATGLEGQSELGLSDVHGHRGLVPVVCHHLVLQPVCGHALAGTARRGLVLHHHSTDVDAAGMNLRGEANPSFGGWGGGRPHGSSRNPFSLCMQGGAHLRGGGDRVVASL